MGDAIRGEFAKLESSELEARFRRMDVWHTVVNTPGMVLQDRRALDINALFRAGGLEGPKKLKLVRSPGNLSGSPFVVPNRAPHLGEHTREVLKDLLGFDDPQILEASGDGDAAR